MPTDATALLRQLTVDRQPPLARRRRAPLWAVVALMATGTAAAVAWHLGALTTPEAGEASGHPSAVSNDTVHLEDDSTRFGPIAADRALQPQPAGGSPPGNVLLNGTGYVVARRQATVSSKTTSRVTEVLIEEGMRVAAGQVLARLDDSNERAELDLTVAEREAAEAQVAELQALLDNAGRELSRVRALARVELASESLVGQRTTEVNALRARIERAHREIVVASRRVQLHETRLADLTIRAPFDGVIIEKSVQPGEMISPVSAGGGFTRTGIGTIVDMDSLEVEVDVNEAYINRVAVDQDVEITLNAYPDHTYQGRVLAVIPTADRSKATIRVRIGFAAIDDHVLPEMGIKAAFLN